MSTFEARYVGVDGCPFGWLSVGFDDYGQYEWKRFKHFRGVESHYSSAYLILVDMPIGLPNIGPSHRMADQEARDLLGNRKSSVFKVPTREQAREAAIAYRGMYSDDHFKQLNEETEEG